MFIERLKHSYSLSCKRLVFLLFHPTEFGQCHKQAHKGVGEIGEKERQGEGVPAIKATFLHLCPLRLRNWINSTL